MALQAVDYRPAWNATLGVAAAPGGSAADTWITVSGGNLMRGASRFVAVGDNLVETALGYDSEAERIGVVARMQAQGLNVARMVGIESKVTPDGLWTDTSYTAFDETYLARVDDTIDRLNDSGLYIWFGLSNHFDRYRIGAGLPGNIQAGSSSFADSGMQWSDEWIAVYKAYAEDLLTRVNTVTGQRWVDNPGVLVWEFFNECGFADAFNRGWFDAIVNNTGGAGYWLTELDAKLAAWATAEGWSVPGGATWPLKATFNGWGASDKARLWEFISDTEVARAVELKAWLKSFNANALFCYGESSYSDIRVAAVNDVASMHAYAQVPSGSALTPPYTTRGSTLSDANGWFWSSVTALRHPDVPLIPTETGQYGLGRYDWEMPVLWGLVNGMQDGAGVCEFMQGQNKWADLVVGIQSTHLTAVWPSRRLAQLAMAPIVKHRFVQPHASASAYMLDPAGIAAEVVADGQVTQSGFRYNSVSDGSEWSWLARRLSTDIGTPQYTTSYKGILDAHVAAGITITLPNGTVFWQGGSTPRIRVDFPAWQGWSHTVPDSGTVGGITISGTGGYVGVCHARSAGDWALGAGRAELFVHGCSYIDATGFTGTADGESVSSWGTEANTRLLIPPPFQVQVDWGVRVSVTAVAANGTATAVATSHAGTVASFTTTGLHAIYQITPAVGGGGVGGGEEEDAPGEEPMFPPVFQRLKASAAVKAIVGTNPPRVYRHGSAPQDTTRPYITWFIVVGTPENTLSELPAVDRVQVQVDCWHQTDVGVEALAQAARDALEPYAHMVSVPIDLREPETRLFRVALTFDWFVDR